MVENLPYDVHAHLHEAEISKAANDWKVHRNGQAYQSRLVDLLGSDPTADLHSHGTELEEAFRRDL